MSLFKLHIKVLQCTENLEITFLEIQLSHMHTKKCCINQTINQYYPYLIIVTSVIQNTRQRVEDFFVSQFELIKYPIG